MGKMDLSHLMGAGSTVKPKQMGSGTFQPYNPELLLPGLKQGSPAQCLSFPGQDCSPAQPRLVGLHLLRHKVEKSQFLLYPGNDA